MMGCIVFDNGKPTVVAVFVTPEARGTGVSDALLSNIEQWVRQHNFTPLRLDVHEANPTARRPYELLT
jgi:GNAT superfamily N-acetyltransferase